MLHILRMFQTIATIEVMALTFLAQYEQVQHTERQVNVSHISNEDVVFFSGDLSYN